MFVLQLKDETNVNLTIYGNVIMLCVLECKARGAGRRDVCERYQCSRYIVTSVVIWGKQSHLSLAPALLLS